MAEGDGALGGGADGDAHEGVEGVATTPRARLEAERRLMRDRLREAQSALAALARKLDPYDGVSPFAPERFPDLPAVPGVTLAAAEAGVRYAGRLDVMLARVDGAPGAPPSLAGVFTRSATRSAPVLWCEERLAAHQADPGDGPLGLLVNAGNSNAFTGDNGRQGVEATATAAAEALGAPADRVMIASTGVIGEPLPAERITAKLADLSARLTPTAWEPAARAIMTTDTYPKGEAVRITLDGAPVTLVGIAKGSGMIAPDMATMLAFVFTDANIASGPLQQALKNAVGDSFNAITVDGDASTSDTLLLASSRRAAHAPIEETGGPAYGQFLRALRRLARRLALQVVKDGEGVTKCVELVVEGAKSRRAARAVAMAIANSPLVKTAFAGEDPNWGRIVMAVGKSGEEADRDRLSIRFGDHPVATNGWRDPAYDEETLAEYMRGDALRVTVDLGIGPGKFTAFTGDLTHGYISINADYRS
ncbi:MAG: bifunctional glutamate N-acetyltransferase/amino-acid acetyltransferase ArgJ [Pseudomonadota bacterium]